MILRQIDSGLNELNQQLLAMAVCVEEAIAAATASWKERDTKAILQVYEIEKKVNAIHMQIDDACFKLLATKAPMANELRLILAVLKINSDLERMVDQAVNIANNAEFYLKFDALPEVTYLEEMAEAVKFMVREAIDSFVKSDDILAKNVIRCDDKVDNYKNKIFHDVLTHIKNEPKDIEQGLNMILIARNLERIGDHSTNVAEDVIFTISGQDIRHFGKSEVPKKIK